MVKCFSICDKQKGKVSTLACQKNDEKIDYIAMYDYICKYKKFPSPLFLRRMEVTRKGLVYSDDLSDVENEWEDYKYNEFAYIMLSEAVKNCLDEFRTPNDDYEWIPVEIIGSCEKRIYYVPFFNSLPDILDEKNTTYLKNGSILRPCYALEKIRNYSMFPSRIVFWEIPTSVDINENVKKYMKKMNFSNISFEGGLCSENGSID